MAMIIQVQWSTVMFGNRRIDEARHGNHEVSVIGLAVLLHCGPHM